MPAAKPITVCKRCYQVIGKGISHPKNFSITDRRINLDQLSMQDPRGRELQATTVVKEVAEAAGTSTFGPLATNSGFSLNVFIVKPFTSKALFQEKPVSITEFSKVADTLEPFSIGTLTK